MNGITGHPFFQQGAFTIDPNASPEMLKRKRDQLAEMVSGLGSARYVGEGLGQLATGVAAGIKGRRMDELEGKRTKEATEAYNGAFGGGSASPSGPLSILGMKGQPQAAQGTPFVPEDGQQSDPYSAFNASLSRTESGGNYNVTNSEGYGGKYQFGQGRLDDFNLANKTRYKVGDLTAGTPDAKLLTEAVQRWHISDIDEFAKRNDLLKYVGQSVGGVTITPDSIRAMAHLGGKGGMQKFLQSGGQYNPSDSNGTSLSDYARTHATPGGGQSAQQGYSGPDMSQLQQLAANPWLTPQQRQMVNAQMQQQQSRQNAQFDQQLRQQDPAYQANLQKSQLEIDAMQRPPERQRIQDQNGQWRYVDDGAAVFPDVEPAAGWQMVSPEQAAQMGLPEGVPHQIGPDGKIAKIGGGGVSVTNNMGQDKFQEAFAKGDAAAVATISETGLAAQRNMGRIDQLESALAGSPTGIAGIATQKAGEWGIKTEGLGEVQAAQALINSLVPEQRQPGSGPMSDADLELFKQSLPRIINQPEGNQMIISTMRAIAQYDAQGGQIVQQLRAGEISRAQAFEQLQSRANPLEAFKAPLAPTPTSSSGPNPYEGMTPEDFSNIDIMTLTPEQTEQLYEAMGL